jgi:hypothetical protein
VWPELVAAHLHSIMPMTTRADPPIVLFLIRPITRNSARRNDAEHRCAFNPPGTSVYLK